MAVDTAPCPRVPSITDRHLGFLMHASVSQVEVSKVDGQTFTLRIFCEKRPGVFVKLMQALDVLGLDILHANITTFRGLVLNVFNAEVKSGALETFLMRQWLTDELVAVVSVCLAWCPWKHVPGSSSTRHCLRIRNCDAVLLQIKDKDLMRVEQVKETLLEMTSQSGAHC